MPLPTLTGALRAFSTVTQAGDDDAESDSRDNDDLVERRRARGRKEMEKGGLGWRQLVKAVERHAKVDKQRVTSALRDLTHMARELGKKSSRTEGVSYDTIRSPVLVSMPPHCVYRSVQIALRIGVTRG